MKDENLIRKCKCKNFVSGLLAHSVVKSQLLAQVGGIGENVFKPGSLCVEHLLSRVNYLLNLGLCELSFICPGVKYLLRMGEDFHKKHLLSRANVILPSFGMEGGQQIWVSSCIA